MPRKSDFQPILLVVCAPARIQDMLKYSVNSAFAAVCCWHFLSFSASTEGAFTPRSIGNVVPKQGDVSSLARLISTYVNTTVTVDAEQDFWRRSPGRQGLSTISFDTCGGLFALKTHWASNWNKSPWYDLPGLRSLVNMENMVFHVYILLSSCGIVPQSIHCPSIFSCLLTILGSTIIMCGVQHLGNMFVCPKDDEPCCTKLIHNSFCGCYSHCHVIVLSWRCPAMQSAVSFHEAVT